MNIEATINRADASYREGHTQTRSSKSRLARAIICSR